mgnify:CR=1 FL=1
MQDMYIDIKNCNLVAGVPDFKVSNIFRQRVGIFYVVNRLHLSILAMKPAKNGETLQKVQPFSLT